MSTTVSFGSGTKGPIQVQVVPPAAEGGVSFLCLKSADYEHDFNLFRDTPDALDQFLEIGYAIVNAVNKLKPAPADAEPAFVPFAINDAVDHDEAMATMPPGYDPDLSERL